MINKPIFGFRNEVKDVSQIFGILGVKRASQVVNAYYATLIFPKKWKVFKMNNNDFQLLQSMLIYNWNKILDFTKYNHIHIASVVSLLPASLIVCEALFEDNIDDISLLKEYQNISYDEILYKMSGLRLFDIFIQICEKWELNDESVKLVEYLSQKKDDNSILSKLARYLHLLIFFELSKPVFIQTGVNDFIEFDIEFVQDVYDNSIFKKNSAIFYPQGFLDGLNANFIIEASDVSFTISKKPKAVFISLKKVIFFNKKGLSILMNTVRKIQENIHCSVGFCEYDKKKYNTILSMFENELDFSLFENIKVLSLFFDDTSDIEKKILVYNRIQALCCQR